MDTYGYIYIYIWVHMDGFTATNQTIQCTIIKDDSYARVSKSWFRTFELSSRLHPDQLMRTHMPFRKWYPCCLKGKRKNDPHRTLKLKEDQEILTMAWAYMEQRGRDGRVIEEDDGRNKPIIGIGRMSGSLQ